jgi:hypothetical protein
MTQMTFEVGGDVTGDIPRDTMKAAGEAGYPQIDLPTGMTIQVGEESWSGFITTASDTACALAHAAVLMLRSRAFGDWTLGA